MTPHPMCLQEVATVGEVGEALKNSKFNGFPTLDTENNLKGLISRKILMLIL